MGQSDRLSGALSLYSAECGFDIQGMTILNMGKPATSGLLMASQHSVEAVGTGREKTALTSGGFQALTTKTNELHVHIYGHLPNLSICSCTSCSS